MPKISALPITDELTFDDLILITDRAGGKNVTRQSTIQALGTFTYNLIPNASSSGSGLLTPEFYQDLLNATSSAIPLTLVKRDEYARFKAESPLVSADVANKLYVDTVVDDLDDKFIKIYKQTVTGAVTTFNIDHNFGTRDVVVQIFDLVSYDTVFADITRTTINQVQISFSSPPGSSSYRVLVQGIQN